MKKALFLAMLVLGLCLTAAPAWAYVELVVAPAGWTVGMAPAEITVSPSDEFELLVTIQSDQSVSTIGLDVYLGFNPEQVEVKQVGGAYPDLPAPVVDETGSTLLPWNSTMPANQGNNLTGQVFYSQQVGLTDPAKVIGAGVTLVGKLTFHCIAVGVSEIVPIPTTEEEMWSYLYDASEGSNLFTSYHGTVVNQVSGVIPEPATMLLLGSGLILGGFAYRKR